MELDPCSISYSNWVTESPDVPSPLELLHGSKHNQLAKAIHLLLRMRACREPERLAYGWLLYVYTKWSFEPTEARWARLPKFLHPLPEQIQYSHPSCLDSFIWPRLRVNFIKNQHRYDLERFGGFISCCMKVRWPWGANVLEADDDGGF